MTIPRPPKSVTLICNGERQTYDGRMATLFYKIMLSAEDILEMESGQIMVNVGDQPEKVKVIVPKVR